MSLLVFPELSVTGYTCGDLFGGNLLVDKAAKAVDYIREHTRGREVTVVGVNNHAEFWNKADWDQICAVESEPENIAAVMDELGF